MALFNVLYTILKCDVQWVNDKHFETKELKLNAKVVGWYGGIGPIDVTRGNVSLHTTTCFA